jgi:L-threonylcarbamoyladenylate synthase
VITYVLIQVDRSDKMIIKKNEIKLIIEELNKGNVCAIPTDTVYGVASIIEDGAIEKLFELKKREQKPIAVLAASIEQFYIVCSDVSDDAKLLIDAFLPGPLTLVLPKKEGLSDILTQGYKTVGVRIPNDETTLKILESVGPLAVTSANISGEEPINSVEELEQKFPEIHILEGKVKIFEPSTVVAIGDEITVLREGPITKKEIENILNK